MPNCAADDFLSIIRALLDKHRRWQKNVSFVASFFVGRLCVWLVPQRVCVVARQRSWPRVTDRIRHRIRHAKRCTVCAYA